MKYNPCSKEFQEKAKELGLSGYQLIQKLKGERKIRSDADINREICETKIKNAGCKNLGEYLDKCAQKLGFKNYSDQRTKYNHETEIHLPMSENKYCSSNFGIDKGEKLFKKFLEDTIFEHVKGSEKGSCDGGVDFICRNPRQDFIDKYPQFKLEKNKEYKIQLAMRCLMYRDDGSIYWNFTHIEYNRVADYFILCGWDDRNNMSPMHIWMFNKNDIVRGEKFWRRNVLSIANRPGKLKEFSEHELYEELETLKKLCYKM